MKIVFMGTPEFAVPSLDILVKNGYDVVGVVTAVDKMGGRRGVLQSAVKQYAVANGLRVLQPEKLKNADFVAELRSLEADLQVVVAFRMLPEMVWNMPRIGTMNLHGSLLPKYRGAAPINWAIMNGETETGCTTFLLQHEIDTGDVLFQTKIDIAETDTFGEIYEKMRIQGADLVLKSVKTLENGDYSLVPQADAVASHAPKIFTETCQLSPTRTREAQHNFVRGLSPVPAAWTNLDGLNLKIYRTTPPSRDALRRGSAATAQDLENLPPDCTQRGILASDGKSWLGLQCADGWLSIEELQLEGKKRMPVRDFLNGFKWK